MTVIPQASVLPRLPMTKALRQWHRDALGESFPVGLTFAPRIDAGSGTSRVSDPPYVVIIPTGSVYSGPPFASPNADVTWEYQVTCVSKTGTQLEWLEDKVLDLWLARDPGGRFVHPLEVEGMLVMDRHPSENIGSEPLGGDLGAVTASTTLRFKLDVTPTPVVVP